MIYSKTCEYAIRALVFYAEHPERESATIAEISLESGVPRAYIAKIFRCLAGSGILKSMRGAAGGFSLVIPAAKLTVLRIVAALDEHDHSPFTNCLMGLDRCDDKNPCPMHPVWKNAKEEILQRLAETTIGSMAELGDKFRARVRRKVLSQRMREVFSF